MAELKRDLVKYIRDKAKSGYQKGTECFICGSQENLDFHHYNSISEMLGIWARKNKLKLETVDDIMSHREQFISDHHTQMYNDTTTLCHIHHLKLHSIYGRNPILATAAKQARWVQKQRDKNDTLV